MWENKHEHRIDSINNDFTCFIYEKEKNRSIKLNSNGVVKFH